MSDEALSDEAFRAELVDLIPALRAFARNLCNGNATLADDVAQDALARAWTSRGSFRAGTNMKAWCFTILRNCYFTDRRRAWRHQSIDSDVLERTLVASDNVEAALELDDVRRALASLPEEQREVLILVGAGGLSYEEAASICGTPLGTTKSRVNRARLKMLEILDRGRPVRDEGLPSTALERLIQETEVRARKPGSRRSEGE